MLSFNELVGRLKQIKKEGYVKTHRSGDTGIGKTLEDLLGIDENNVPSPNAHMIELKSARKKGSSMLTLFTKSPLPEKANSVLLETFGYESAKGNKKKELHTTVKSNSFNTLKGKDGFKIDIKGDRIELVTKGKPIKGSVSSLMKRLLGKENKQRIVLGYWTKETLKNSFERKLPELLYVKAESKGKGSNEEFWFNEAWLLSGFDFANFLRLVDEGTICVDIRIGQYPDGRPHDHGTGFRVHPDKLDLCFENRKNLI